MNSPVYTFLLGVNDSRNATVVGLDQNGKMLYGWEGNTDFRNYTRAPAQSRLSVPILWFETKDRQVSKPAIFVNCITDADSMTKSLARVTALLDGVSKHWPDVPIFNEPRKIAETRRDTIYQKFHHLPGIEIPKTVRFQPKNPADVLAEVDEKGFSYPVIVRPCGTHQGRGVVLLKSPADAGLLDCLAFDGAYFYMTQFSEYKNADGLYIKTRFVMLGGKMYLRHSIAAAQWKVHAASRNDLMKDSQALRDLEQQMLATFTEKLSPAARDSIEKIYEAAGLDYLGFDCCLRPDGTLLFFEINAAQDAMAKSDYAIFPYLKGYVDAIINAYNALLAEKTGQRKARLSA